jgi:dTDP-4-dehydrorhamnose reductase
VKVLVIGSDTPVGLALCDYLEMRETEHVPLARSDCRWKSERQAKKALRRSDCSFAIETRLQAAADGGVRIREGDIDRCAWLARASQNLKLPLMLLSSSVVFSGVESRAYREEDYPDGDSGLARLLIAAEAAIRDHCERHVILRMGPVFSPSGSTVLTQLLDRLHDQGELLLSRQRKTCPVPAEDAARVISGMIDQYGCGLEAWGIYHYGSADMTSCYEFAEVLLAAASQYTRFDKADPPALIAEEQGEAAEYRLQCDKIRNTFAIKQQPWRASVAGHVKQYYLRMQEKAIGESYGHRDASA